MNEPRVEQQESPKIDQQGIGIERNKKKNQRAGEYENMCRVEIANGGDCQETAQIKKGNLKRVLKTYNTIKCHGIGRIRQE